MNLDTHTIKLSGLALPPGFTLETLHIAVAQALLIDPEEISSVQILRQAVDARKKSDVHMSVTVCVQTRHVVGGHPAYFPPEPYVFSHAALHSRQRPVVAGSGPAGVFCALSLAQAGLNPILLERGRCVEQRQEDVDRFFADGLLCTESNVQFGEGGAGTFSDGKLTTGTKDIRQNYVIDRLIDAGAPADIRYLAKPHIGTDRLRSVVATLRGELIRLGGSVLFETKLTGFSAHGGKIHEVYIQDPNGKCTIETEHLVLAVGHSARDTFEMLHHNGVQMVPKNFAVGVRIEHKQNAIDLAQYGSIAEYKSLPVSDYKLACHLPNGRSAFTFCVCPGGTIVAAASEDGGTVTNGMSGYARDGENCNGGFLVGVTTEDFADDHPLAGVAYQRALEQRAYLLGGGGYIAPAQTVGDFLLGRASIKFGSVTPTYRPGVKPTDIRQCLPEYITQALHSALVEFSRKIKGFAAKDAVLTAVETRSSSPVRILRDDSLQSNIKGLFPCGEGAGYAGGIMSAAVDGIKCAEKICEDLHTL